jgi:hypothetical protein
MPTSLRSHIRSNGAYSSPRDLEPRDWLIGVVLGVGLAVSVLLALAAFLGSMWLCLWLIKALIELVRS